MIPGKERSEIGRRKEHICRQPPGYSRQPELFPDKGRKETGRVVTDQNVDSIGDRVEQRELFLVQYEMQTDVRFGGQ